MQNFLRDQFFAHLNIKICKYRHFGKDFFTNFKSLALKTEVKNKDLEILDMIHLIYEL